MLLGYETLVYYGPGASSGVGLSTTTVNGGIKARAKAGAVPKGTGSVPKAKGTRLINRPATLTGEGEVISAYPKARGRIPLTISIGAKPSAFDIAQAVWGIQASSQNLPATMGEKLNGAGSAGNPWTEVIGDSGMTANQVLRVLLSVASGKTTIVDNGNGTATVTFKNTDGTSSVVTASMTGSERTTITYDI